MYFRLHKTYICPVEIFGPLTGGQPRKGKGKEKWRQDWT